MKNIFYFFAVMLSLPALVCHAQEIDLVFHWEDPTIPGSAEYNNAYNEVWGLVVEGREFAVIGSTMGTHIFDITDIANVDSVAFIPGKVTGPAIIHRDYHDYNGLLYIVADEGISSLQIVDISQLPESVEVVYDSGELITRAHNIFIDTTAAVLYGCGISTGTGSSVWFGQYDISNVEPVFLNSAPEAGYVHDMYVRDNIAYVLAGSSGGLYIIDFTDPTNYTVLGSLLNYSAFGQGYTHSGWLSDDGNTFVFADENHGLEMKICDVSDPTDITVESTCWSEVDEQSMAHNQMIKGDFLYTANYHDGLVIHDISNPQEPELLAIYDTYSPLDHDSYRGAWGIYCYLPSGRLLVSDMQYGLFVFEFDLSMPQATALHDNSEAFEAGIMLNANQIQWSCSSCKDETTTLSLIDLSGRRVHEQTLAAGMSSGTISVPGSLPAGVLIAEMRQGTKQFTQKVIIGSKP